MDLGIEDQTTADSPFVEIINEETGEVRTIEPELINSETLNFKGPFVTEEIDEQHYVNADRIVYKSIYTRVVRATDSGFRIFPWGFGETPADLQVNRVQLGVRSPALVDRVACIGHNSYAVDFALPQPLKKGETCKLNFFKIIDAIGYCDHFIGGSSAVELEKCRIAVIFESGFEPEKVWWFSNLTPYSLPGIFTEDRRLRKRATGQYEKKFGPVVPATMIGIAWSYE